MKTIKQEYIIDAALMKVWEAFVDPGVIKKWSGSAAVMDDREGTKFELWGGEIHGTNTKVMKNKTLEQDWYGGEWDEPSKVKFELSSEGDKTKIKLIHENVPDKEIDNIDDGWHRYYLGPMKVYLEK